MESTKEQVVIYTYVDKLEETFQITGTDKDGTVHKERLGWFALFEGSRENIYVGETKPNFKVGDLIKITIGKADAKSK